MGRKEKLLKEFLENPNSLTYRQIEKILLWMGFEMTVGKGSHMIFRYKRLRIKIPIPVHNNDCRKYYKEKVAKIIKNKFL